MATINGASYVSGGWKFHIKVDYGFSSNPRDNSTSVTWRLYCQGTASNRPPYPWVNGTWRLRINGNVVSATGNSARENIQQIRNGDLASGTVVVHHDGNGNGRVNITLESCLYYYTWQASGGDFDLPKIDRSGASLNISYVGSGTNSLTFKASTNHSCSFDFAGRTYSLGDNASTNITISNLSPNRSYSYTASNITRNYNGAKSNNINISAYTNGYINATTAALSFTRGGQSVTINNVPSYSGAYNSASIQYSLNGGGWTNLAADRTITGLNYHTQYQIKLRVYGTYYNNNQITTYTSPELSGTVTTKYRAPVFSINLKNTGTRTEMQYVITPVSTAGCQNSYSYSITLSSGSDSHRETTGNKAAHSGTYSGKAGLKYSLYVVATDSDGTSSVQSGAQVVCGAASEPIFGTSQIESYITTITIKSIPYEIFSTGSATISLMQGNVTKYSVNKKLNIGSGSLTEVFEELTPNSQYTVKVVIKDSNSHSTTYSYNIFTYPKVPEILNLRLNGQPKAKQFSIIWDAITGPEYSSNVVYNIDISAGDERKITASISQKNYTTSEDLTPETKYTVKITPSNGYTYKEGDVKEYTLEVTTDAESWLYVHLKGANDESYHRYKIYLINNEYPDGYEIKKPLFRLIR